MQKNTESFGQKILLRICILLVLLLVFIPSAYSVGLPDYLPDGPHPRIWLTKAELARLEAKRSVNDSSWLALQAWCDLHLKDAGYNSDPSVATSDTTNWIGNNNYTGYRMGGWAEHIMNYALAYQILKSTDSEKALTYANRARTLIVDGIANYLKAGEEPNGLWALRIGNSHDISVNADEVAAQTSPHIEYTAYKKPYSDRYIYCVPIAYDWLYNSGVLSSSDKKLITNMLLRWFDWLRGQRSTYNNGVLKNGIRYHEDQTGDCTGINNCTTLTGEATMAYDYAEVFSNMGTGHMALMSLIPVALYGDNADIPSYLALWKKHLADHVIEPLTNDLKHSGGESVEGWNYGGGFMHLLPALYGYYTATGDTSITDMQWIPDLITAMVHRLESDYRQVPYWGYWTGIPAGENRRESVLPFTAINQRINPASTSSRIGQWLLSNVTYNDRVSKLWANVLWPRTDVTELNPSGQPLTNLARGNGYFTSRSSWTNASDTVTMVAHLDNKHSLADHEGRDKGHFSFSRGTDRLLTHPNEAGDLPPTISFNTIAFNDISQFVKNPIVSNPAIDRIESSSGYSYVSAEMSNVCKQAYSADACKLFRRSMLHILPNILITYDITRSNTAYSNIKNWYTQYTTLPSTTTDTIYATVGNSKVFVKTLYPSGGAFTTTNPYTGSYRVKYTPAVQQEYDQFLHVIEATSSSASQTSVEKILTVEGKMIGALIMDASKPTVALFNSNKNGGDITVVTGEIISYSIPESISASLQHILVHLSPNMDFTILASTTSDDKVTFKLKAGAFPDEGTVKRVSGQGVLTFGDSFAFSSAPPAPPAPPAAPRNVIKK